MSLSHKKGENVASFLDEYPLTQGQAALWFHYKLAPLSVAYNLSGAVAVPSNTDLEALQRAFQKLAERHPMLRTLFAAERGEPVQRVYSSLNIAFQVEDASKWELTQLDRRLAEEIYRPFDLERGPTWRVVVLQGAPIPENTPAEEHLVLLVLHHIIVDLWSIAILLSEVAALYRQETTGAPASLKPLRVNFADHVKREVQRLSGPQAEMGWNYWQTALSGELPSLSLQTDRPRQSGSTGRGAAHSILLDKKLTHKLRALARKQHVPLYTVLLAGFQTLLHRYTDQNDILVGFPKACRSSSTVRVVGYFINQMVVRADFSDDPSFIGLLNSVQKTIEASSQHDWYPFSLLVQRLQPERELNRSPLIQTVFSWQQAPRLIPSENAGLFILGEANQTVELNGLFVRSVHLPYHVAPFDLIMLAADASEGLAITIEYATDLFDPPTIARMAASYQTLLESITSAPEQPVSTLTILPDMEREMLVDTWNATAAPYPSQFCLHQLFEQQAERTPEIKAVADEDDQVTYRRLNLQANQLAHFIQEQGVGPNSLVGVYLEPSVQMIKVVLAILKAGGAYLPLDPNNPKERLAFMLADARPDMLITCQALRTRLPDFAGALFIIDTEEDKLATRAQDNLSSVVTPDHLAYVIYTSGSTGQPKGVKLAHRGVVNLLAEFQRRQAIQPGEVCSWWTSPSFDVSVYEIFSPLLAGGSLRVIPENIRLDALSLFGWLEEHSIRSAYLPPFLLEDFAAWVQRHPGASQLRRLLVGVEPIPDVLLTNLNARLPALCILNGYGPTETTICSTLYVVDTAHPHPGNVPIGRPVANTQIYLLDSRLEPVPVGVVGELYIGGVGLAHGYLNRPNLTAQRFIQSPFLPGELLYRTGDLARYLRGSNLLFVGRSDTQVKLHGVRIELAEVEATLTQHPGVKQAVVRLHEQISGGKHLVAYITTSHDTPPSPEELRVYLSLRLPPSMIPSAFVVLDSFPLTTTGKVNRKALPVPEKLLLKQKSGSTAPQTNVEQTLASIWEQVLGIERIGRDDNFFELGGDSILSLQIVALAAEAGLRLKPQDIFQAPTIAGLATLAKPVEPVQEPLIQVSAEGAIPLTPIKQVAGFFIDELRNLIAHCRSPQVVGYTPSDFPSANLSQAELDTIVGMPSGPDATVFRRNLEAIYPLSPMQQGMIFHTLYTPESGIYFEQITFTIKGQFDISAFEKAWQRVLDRHTILRTSFVWQGFDRMLQIVHKDVKPPLRLQNWREVPVIEQQDRFEHLLTEERQRGFDLSVPPLLRPDILQINDDTYTILLNLHHALLDGWSVSLLLEEVFAFYDAATRHQDLALPPAKPYQDYITWLQTKDLAVAEAFWRKELDDFVPFALNPLAASSFPPSGASRPAKQEVRLSTLATTALQTLARQEHLTVSTFVQGAWAVLLSRSFHRDDVLFGITVSGRSFELPGCLTMIGLFINTLPLRVRIDLQAPLLTWLQRIQAKAIEIQQFDYSPLAQIQTWSGLPRSSPLFDTLLVFENYPAATPIHEQFGSLSIHNIRSIEQTTYPLTIAITPGERLSLRILYDPARFDPDDIHRLLNQLTDVMERMLSNPKQSLAELYEGIQLDLDEFVESQTGKEEAVSRAEQFSSPSSPLEKYITEQWKKLLNIERLNVNDNFFQLGGDSLKGAVCTYKIQDAMQETIPLTAIFEAPTISEYAQYLERNHSAGVARLFGIPTHISITDKEDISTATIVPIQPKGSQPPLFCIHPAGGIVFPYYALSAYFDKDRPLYGIQDPSLYGTEVPESIEAMAASYIEAIETVQPEGPYHLLGWSAGSVVAYEMTQQLSKKGQYVANLFLLDTFAPAPAETAHPRLLREGWQQWSLAWIKALPDHIQEVPSAIKPITSYIRSGLFLLAASSKQEATLPDGRPTLGSLLGWAGLDTWRALLLRGDTEIASAVSQETSLLLIRMPAVRRILELVREHRRLVRRYRAESYGGNITLFRAMSSGSKQKVSADPTLGWGTLAQNGVEVRTLQANHVALFVKPHIRVLAQELMACLNRK